MVGYGEQELSLNGNLGGNMGVWVLKIRVLYLYPILGMGWLRVGRNGNFWVRYPKISNKLGYFSLL